MRRFFVYGTVILSAMIFGGQNARADVLGQNSTFFTETDYDATGASSITATLKTIGEHGYFYVDDRYLATLSPAQQEHFNTTLSQLAQTFDAQIYPRSTAFWGSENNPGVDGDPHIVILVERMVSNAGGYFQTIDNYPKSVAPRGNAREMFYLNADSVLSDQATDFMAHEFQHVISFYRKELLQGVHDDIWTNEARSEYNITQVGYTAAFDGSQLQYRMFSFLRTPSDSLVEWPNTATDYGGASMFIHYLADRFGPDLAAGTIRIPQAGVATVDAWLFQNHQNERFPDVFTDWMVASYLNDPTLGAQYAYARPELRTIRVTPQQATTLGAANQYDATIPLKEWQPYWLALNIAPDVVAPALNIKITGQPGPWWGGAVISVYNNGTRAVTTFSATDAQHPISIPVTSGTGHLVSATVALTQGTDQPVGT